MSIEWMVCRTMVRADHTRNLLAASSKFIFARHLSTLPAHDSISSFLRYAHLACLDPERTVFTGTLYEYTVQSALSRLPGITLSRVGGKDDQGVDLIGSWNLPQTKNKIVGSAIDPQQTQASSNNNHSHVKDLPLIIQCKYGTKSWKGPQYVRELEGALSNYSRDTMGVLASIRDMTPGMRKQMLASRRALGFVKISPLDGLYVPRLELTADEISAMGEEEVSKDTNDEVTSMGVGELEEEAGNSDLIFRLTGRGGLLQQFVWNEVANRSLGGFGIGARYVPRAHAIQGAGVEGFEKGSNGLEEEELEEEITLTWHGVPILG